MPSRNRKARVVLAKVRGRVLPLVLLLLVVMVQLLLLLLELLMEELLLLLLELRLVVELPSLLVIVPGSLVVRRQEIPHRDFIVCIRMRRLLFRLLLGAHRRRRPRSVALLNTRRRCWCSTVGGQESSSTTGTGIMVNRRVLLLLIVLQATSLSTSRSKIMGSSCCNGRHGDLFIVLLVNRYLLLRGAQCQGLRVGGRHGAVAITNVTQAREICEAIEHRG